MAIWKTLPQNVPVDQDTVWVRIEPYYSQPFLALWDAGSQIFRADSNGLAFPWYVVSRWREQ